MRRLLVSLFVLCASGIAQSVSLRVNGAAPLTIDPETFSKLPRHTAILNNHGKQIRYEGVLLRDVLARAGVDFSKPLRGKQLSTYVLATASDGYAVLYALAELDPSVTDSELIVADRREGQPLAAEEGPLRIVAPHDKRPVRSLRMLRAIDVVQLSR